MQYSVGIATEQSFRYIELTDAIIWISKKHYYVGFWQIWIHMYVFSIVVDTHNFIYIYVCVCVCMYVYMYICNIQLFYSMQTYMVNILPAVNPYCKIGNLYSPKSIKRYNEKSFGVLPPHVFCHWLVMHVYAYNIVGLSDYHDSVYSCGS